MTIGGKIRRYRKLAGLTTEELAKRVNVSRPTISRYESDEINISVDMIGKIAKALNISPVELLDLSYLDSEVEAVPVPTLGEVAGGPPIDALEDAYEEFSISKALAQRGTFATFKIKGDSLLRVIAQLCAQIKNAQKKALPRKERKKEGPGDDVFF